jgi:hypothetical protein
VPWPTARNVTLAALLGAAGDRLAYLHHLASWLPLLANLQLSQVMLLFLFFLMGLGASCFSWACVKEVNPHALSGMATSVANTGAFLGTGILQPLVGRSIDLSGSYATGLWILFGFAAVGFVGALRIRETYCRYVTGTS